MAAYAIGHLTIQDPAWTEEYREKLLPILEKHGGNYLAAGGTAEVLEGDQDLPTALVVLAFPSMEKAKAWYNDPDYLPLRALRQSGSALNLVLVEGI